jgi:hypothetical protein
MLDDYRDMTRTAALSLGVPYIGGWALLAALFLGDLAMCP